MDIGFVWENGSIDTIRDKEFDYQSYMRENPPDPSQIHRGPGARKQRLEAARMKSSVRIDEEILDQFRQLSSDSYENLINKALREWLAAKGVKELVREELPNIIQETLASRQTSG